MTTVAQDDFVLQKYDGSTETVDTSGSSTYPEPGNSTTLPGVLHGENVAVTLDPSASSPRQRGEHRQQRPGEGPVW